MLIHRCFKLEHSKDLIYKGWRKGIPTALQLGFVPLRNCLGKLKSEIKHFAFSEIILFSVILLSGLFHFLTEKFLDMISRYRFVHAAPTGQPSVLHPGHRGKWQTPKGRSQH